MLPSIVSKFKREFPGVDLVLHQGGPAEIVALMMSGSVDIPVVTEAFDGFLELVTFPISPAPCGDRPEGPTPNPRSMFSGAAPDLRRLAFARPNIATSFALPPTSRSI
ncbi:MAG TPA: hypothetical protein VKY22_18160 [Bradyrhizobium sp.]|nr:hypothetical protein [Bradyrhizobium sp.]